MSNVYDQIQTEQDERKERIRKIDETLTSGTVSKREAKKLRKEKKKAEAEATGAGQLILKAKLSHIKHKPNE